MCFDMTCEPWSTERPVTDQGLATKSVGRSRRTLRMRARPRKMVATAAERSTTVV